MPEDKLKAGVAGANGGAQGFTVRKADGDDDGKADALEAQADLDTEAGALKAPAQRIQVWLGSGPHSADIAQAGEEGYRDRARVECMIWRRQILRALRNEVYKPKDKSDLLRGLDARQLRHLRAEWSSLVNLRVRSEQHDFGPYLELVGECDENDDVAIAVVFWLEAIDAADWDAMAQEELADWRKGTGRYGAEAGPS